MNKFNFPHPVLTSKNIKDRDFIKTCFDVNVRFRSDIDYWIFEISNTIDNKTILNLLESNKASIFTTIKSQQTLFNEKYSLAPNDKIEIKINKNAIKANVEVFCSIILKQDETIIFNDLNDEFYDSGEFSFKKNEIIGVSDFFNVKIHPPYVKDTPIQTDKFFFIKKGDKDYTWFKIEHTNITIYLPREDHKLWRTIQEDSLLFNHLNTTMKMKYLTPVWVHIFEKLKYKREEFESYDWFSDFEKAIKNHDINEDNSFEAAQKVMRLIISGQDTYSKSWKNITELKEKIEEKK